MYFFDLIGAAAGCLLLVPFLNVVGGPNTVIIASVAFAASSAIWFNLAGSSRGRMGGRGSRSVVRRADHYQLEEALH